MSETGWKTRQTSSAFILHASILAFSDLLRATARSAKRVLAIVESSVRLSVRHTAVLCQNDAS